MDNNKLDAQLRRDTATANGLQADKDQYQPLEEDTAPLREEHATNLAQARLLEDAVMGETSITVTQQKASAKKLLKALAPRLAAALQGYAASKANTDEDLAGRVRYSRSDLAETTRQLARFEQKQASQRTTVVAGSTDRKTLIALLRRNANLIKEMRVQLKAYEKSPAKHEVWQRFQGYTKLIILGGGGPKGGKETKPAA